MYLARLEDLMRLVKLRERRNWRMVLVYEFWEGWETEWEGGGCKVR
jgi:hypothetical protein